MQDRMSRSITLLEPLYLPHSLPPTFPEPEPPDYITAQIRDDHLVSVDYNLMGMGGFLSAMDSWR